jgi:uncharacterized DUF497 family protein
MESDEFERDDDNAERNWREHGISFDMAQEVFSDVFALDWTDRDHDAPEERFATLGMVEGRLIFVSYTVRGLRIRIISARLAEPYERRSYHNANQT